MAHSFLKFEIKASLAFTVGLTVLFFCFGSIQYETNDDLMITALVKGLFGLSPSAEGVFISPFLGTVLFLLYKFLPTVSWFSFILYFGVVLSCFLASQIILTSVRTLGGKISGLLGVAFFVCLTVFQINFTAVSLLLWITGCAYLLHSVRHNMAPDVWFWLASVQLAAAYLLRPSLLPILLLFSVPLLLALLLGERRRVAYQALSPFVVALALSLLSGFVIRGGDTYPEYQEFNKIRGEFNDTSRALPGPQTPQALSAAKWSHEDYLISRNWWLHDSTFFNADQIKTFLENNAARASIFSFNVTKTKISEYAVYLSVILIWILVLSLPINTADKKKIRFIDLLLYSFLILVVLLLMGIRFPPRIAYPCFLMLFLNAVMIFDHLYNQGLSEISQNTNYHKINAYLTNKLKIASLSELSLFDSPHNDSFVFRRIIPPALFVVLLVCFFAIIANKKMEEVKQIKVSKEYIDQSLLSILQTNGADSIIVDVTPHLIPTNYLPFQENDAILQHRIMPGGWLVGSPAYLDFLNREKLGDRSTVVPSMIDNQRIVLRFWDTPKLQYDAYLENIFLQHLRQRYTVPGSARNIDLKILADHRQGNGGLVYLHLVTVPLQPTAALSQESQVLMQRHKTREAQRSAGDFW